MTDDRRKRRWPFFDPFDDEDDFEKEFDRIREMMERMMTGYRAEGDGEASDEPLVYGFTYRKGTDGVPYFEEFGNAKRFQGQPPHSRELTGETDEATEGASATDEMVKGVRAEAESRREPLTDVIVEGKDVAVTVEIPGVDKKNIKLDVLDDALIIDVDDPARKYYKEVSLPVKVVTGSVKATYNNGVLDVVLQVDDKRKDAKRVNVE